jgi:cytidylate kinase
VVCPFERRAQAVAERLRLDTRAARRETARRERERLAFLRHHFKGRADQAADYDVVVNTGVLPLDQAAEVVLAAYRAKFARVPDVPRPRRSVA